MTDPVTAVSLAFLVLFLIGIVAEYTSPEARDRRRINRWQHDRLIVPTPNRRQ